MEEIIETEEERIMTETPTDIDEGARWNDLRERSDKRFAEQEIKDALALGFEGEHYPLQGSVDMDRPAPVQMLVGTGHAHEHESAPDWVLYEIFATPAELMAFFNRPKTVQHVFELSASSIPMEEYNNPRTIEGDDEE